MKEFLFKGKINKVRLKIILADSMLILTYQIIYHTKELINLIINYWGFFVRLYIDNFIYQANTKYYKIITYSVYFKFE